MYTSSYFQKTVTTCLQIKMGIVAYLGGAFTSHVGTVIELLNVANIMSNKLVNNTTKTV